MNPKDFDEEIQYIFNNSFREWKNTKWMKWLEINSNEEYEKVAFKASGIINKEEFNKKLRSTKTNPREFSIDRESYILSNKSSKPIIFCHTSGTTDAKISNLKWFHMDEVLIKQIWIPGMSAIFQSSGLDHETSAVIFVPSRIESDGIRNIEEKEYVSLYSSEFSQRLTLSVINPKDYLLYEYKKAKHLNILSKILSMENISVISAPAATILGWADKENLKNGILSSLKQIESKKDYNSNKLQEFIKKEGINNGVRKIQALLSEKLSPARLIFSTSNLSESHWEYISKFMKWSDGKRNFTNLYVGSEIGPFACSLTDAIANKNQMHIFPLTIPVIESNRKRELISETKMKYGNLLISYSVNSKDRINIDTGDVISIQKQEGLPIIGGNILRKEFKLKYPIKISSKIKKSPGDNVFVGHYFSFKEFEIRNSINLIECLKNKAILKDDYLLLVNSNKKTNKYELLLSVSNETKHVKVFELENQLMSCNLGGGINSAIENKKLKLRLIKEPPIDFMETREKMLSKVRKGKSPKGVLKKWPLYVIERLNYQKN